MNLKRMKQADWLLVAIAVICSFTLWGQRLQSEADYKNVQMVVNYNDIVALANGNDMTQEELAASCSSVVSRQCFIRNGAWAIWPIMGRSRCS